MRVRRLMGVALVATALAVAAGCGGGGDSGDGASTEGASSSDVLRIGTTNYIDSLNPFNYIESQAYTAMMMIYPQLVQYNAGFEFEGDWAESWTTSDDGKDWTFKLRPGHQVVRRRADDRRRRRLDDQHDREVRGRRNRRRCGGARATSRTPRRPTTRRS